MKIEELVKNFSNGATTGQASGGRVRIDGAFLINYDTTIAERVPGGVRLNVRKYSRTTSKLQNKIRYYCKIIEEYEGASANFYNWGWYC